MHAARSIGGERDRQTLDSLLTTQLRPAEIVRDKWWGSLLAGRWVFLWLLIHWCLGMLPFALRPSALPVLAVETVIYAAFAASLGMYCSVRFATTRQAITATLLIGLIGTMLLPWAAGKAGAILLYGARPPPPTPAQLIYTRNPYSDFRDLTPWPGRLGLGLMPPWVLIQTVQPFRTYEYLNIYEPDQIFTAYSAVGLLAYAAVAYALGKAAARRFRRSLPGHAAKPMRRRHSSPPPQVILTSDL
jgi:ABC-type Na+ efflux pump permease subunit